MEYYKVQSLPLKDVITDLANEFHTTYKVECDLYILKLPPYIGKGFIRGIDFNNGLGLLFYDCIFNDDVQINFVVDEVHPMKYLYCLNGSLVHKFGSPDSKSHRIERFLNIIVACSDHVGHILQFKKRTRTVINSLEVDRNKFSKELDCEILQLNSDMKNALTDVNGSHSFIYSGDYSLPTAKIFEEIENFQYEDFLRKGFLNGKAWEILVFQTIQYSKNQINKGSKDKSDINVDMVRKAILLIDDDVVSYDKIDVISNELGITSKKLQRIFKKYQGQTINAYVVEKRLELIVELLNTTNHTIKVISELVGLKNRSYLAKIFKDNYGITPTEYRENKVDSELT